MCMLYAVCELPRSLGIFPIECATPSDCFLLSVFFLNSLLSCDCEALDLLRGPFPHEEAASPARCGTLLKSHRLGSYHIITQLPWFQLHGM